MTLIPRLSIVINHESFTRVKSNMFCQKKKNKKAQITTEYAILVAVIIAALAGMQIYLKRGIQARLKNAIDYSVVSGVFNTPQYEPGYMDSSRADIRDYEVKEEMGRGASITRKTTEIISSNTTAIIGDL